VVLGVIAQVLGERGDALAENRDLYLRGPRIRLVPPMIGDGL
jgi:hypothetical protein